MDFNEFLDGLKKWTEKPHMFILDPVRFKEVEAAYQKLKEIVLDISPDATIEINESKLNDGSYSIVVEADELIVYNVNDFIDVIKCADNFEVYPLRNRNIRISFMFAGVMKLIK